MVVSGLTTGVQLLSDEPPPLSPCLPSLPAEAQMAVQYNENVIHLAPGPLEAAKAKANIASLRSK